MSGDAKTLLETAVARVLDEVPALKPLKIVVGVDLIGRGDVQRYRIDMPSVEVRKDIATDARIRLELRRDFFNLMLEHEAKVADWREGFYAGRVKATGVEQYMRLIAQVIEKQEERNRLRRAKH